jgi:hypothetical protein
VKFLESKRRPATGAFHLDWLILNHKEKNLSSRLIFSPARLTRCFPGFEGEFFGADACLEKSRFQGPESNVYSVPKSFVWNRRLGGSCAGQGAGATFFMLYG